MNKAEIFMIPNKLLCIWIGNYDLLINKYICLLQVHHKRAENGKIQDLWRCGEE